MFLRNCAAIAVVMLLFGWPATTSAEPVLSGGSSINAPALAFLQAAEALYTAAVRGDTAAIRLQMRETEARFRSLPMKRISTAEGIEALAGSIARMKRAAAAVSFDEGKATAAAAEIRLAADALAHPDKPMWHGYRAIMLADIDSLSEAMAQSAFSAASLGAFNRLKGHYERIRSSVLLQSEPYLTERADSVLRYAGRVLRAPNGDPALREDLIPSLRESLQGLFPEQQRNQPAVAPPVPPASGPPWGWSAFMGMFIVAVLAWVGWRRYRTGYPVHPPEQIASGDPGEMLLRNWRHL